jgi:glycosyltransferase involved in cell wall biosynthesis
MNGVSVIICAHNSAQRLQPTLEAIARCRSKFAVEVIVVDNNSTDDTASQALEVWSATGNERFTFLVVGEAQPGLAYARRAGTKAASHDVIVFCDDDNWLCEDYLVDAIRIMADPAVGAAGGCSTPTRPERLPPWFYTFSWGYAVGAPLGKINDLPEFPETERAVSSLWGAGLVVRRDAMEFLFSLPAFPALTGRNGTTLLSGDDLEISTCLACGGHKLVFSEALRFEHDIAPERLDPGCAKRLFENFGIGFTAMGQYHEIIEAFESPGVPLSSARPAW